MMKSRSGPARAVFASMALGAALCGPPVFAQTAGAEKKAEPENPEEFSRVRGLFEVDLPKTVEKLRLKVTVHPHFGDFLNRDYLRVPVGARLGLTDSTEVNAEVEGYVTHGLKRTNPGNGFDLVRLGAKHQWRDWLKPHVDTSTGLNTAFPVGRPPLTLTDGFNHVSPYVTFSKRWPTLPRFTPFVTFGTDAMWKSSVPGSFTKNQPHSDSMGASAGFLYDLGAIKYTLVGSYWTTSLIGKGDRNFASINPSVLLELPPALTFGSKGRWIFGIGLKANFGPDGTDLGTSAKLRGEFKFLRLFGAKP